MQIEAYLTFAGNCEEALNFYVECLGGKIEALMRFEGSPMDNEQLPPGWKNKVLHSTFDSEGARFMASDGMPPSTGSGQAASPPAYGGFAMSVYVPQDKDKARRIFDALGRGGKVDMPFEPPFWGGTFGMVTDRFGVPWMVSCDQ